MSTALLDCLLFLKKFCKHEGMGSTRIRIRSIPNWSRFQQIFHIQTLFCSSVNFLAPRDYSMSTQLSIFHFLKLRWPLQRSTVATGTVSVLIPGIGSVSQQNPLLGPGQISPKPEPGTQLSTEKAENPI